jgi:2-aminoadipate transaminase
MTTAAAAAALRQTAPAAPAARPNVAERNTGLRAGSAADWRFAPAAAALEGSAIREILKVTEQPAVLSFAGGLPNPAAFPVEALRAATARVLTDDASAALQYGPTEGYGPLRELVAARLSAAGQPTTPAEVLITTGSQQALDLVGKAFLAPGDALLARNPTYLGALQAFALQSPRVLDLDAWIAAEAGSRRVPQSGGGPAFCYLTPNFANPDGTTMPTQTRRALLARLDHAGLPLVEDDPYGELWSDAPPPPACRALAPQRALYLGSFSKVLAPGLRVGYVAGPRPAIELLTRLKQAADLHTPSLNQRIVAALIADGTLDRHLPAVRVIYRAQRDALLAAMDRHLGRFATWDVPQGGMFAWATLRAESGLAAKSLFERALARQVAFVPGAPFYFASPDPRTLRLAFSTLPAARMDEGMARLAAACEDALAPGGKS